jgi:hypothetical protein
MKLSIDQWGEIREEFTRIFHGLGKVETTEEIIRFSSIEPFVSTGIVLFRDGTMAANMPLHNLNSKFDEVVFDTSLEQITLLGSGFNYTYRIPDELLAQRSN